MSKAAAFLALAIVALWAALPAAVCALPSHQQHGCCSHMPKPCDMPPVVASRSCCELQVPSPDPAPVQASPVPQQIEILPASLSGLFTIESGRLNRSPRDMSDHPHTLSFPSSILRI